MRRLDPTSAASWRHRAVRSGFEVAFFPHDARGRRLVGETVALETVLRRDGDGWTVDGEHRPELDGCVDVDLESSVVTNTIPVRRIDRSVGEAIDAPAALVRADGLGVERLEQRYALIAQSDAGVTFRYESSTFGVSCELQYDRAGLVVEYPGIAVRTS